MMQIVQSADMHSPASPMVGDVPPGLTYGGEVQPESN